jgi:two-component system response regulator
LLVEDDDGDEMITREAFEHNKIANKLHVARDGAEGLDFLYRRGEHHNAPRPDLILLDLNLPKYDGRQILEILKTDPTLHHIPIVVLTTSTAQEDILRSYKLHANAYSPNRSTSTSTSRTFAKSTNSSYRSCGYRRVADRHDR